MRHNAADAFVLALALAFNDMKGVQWMILQLDKCKPDEERIDPGFGQWTGMKLQGTRLSLLILHELLKAIKTAQDEHVFDDGNFSETLRRLDGRYRANWEELVGLSNSGHGDSEVRKYIERVRHNFAAHYYQPTALLNGYQGFFFEQQGNMFNEHAFASFGPRIEATRFYFADAAVQKGQMLLDPSDMLVVEVRAYVVTMFQALRFLIETYLTVKLELAGAGK
jgi:hypothetical protein